MKTRKSWREKLEGAHEARVVAIPPKMQKQLGKGTMLIPRPIDVDALIRKVPRGKVVTLTELREKLARAAGADATCAMVAGMFVRIAAEAAAEDIRAGKSKVTPYWRVVRDDGRLLEKLPGGPSEQARNLEAEGHEISYSAKLRVIS
jgi:alkylated DNA nucleotide flippase Atl1